ncbi:MAG: ChaN family lipoprotein [Bacteroidia bacterium]|nr:ChaN family lipoprotein [Bacteroidia bacterium]
MAQDKPAYRLFDGQGKALSWRQMLKLAADADVICFGELHNNPIAHWLQHELAAELIRERGAERVAVGMEMFETDQQTVLDRYLSGEWDRERLGQETRLWPNFDTDYAPLVNLCRTQGVQVWATNAPREYARMVARGGLAALDTLPPAGKALLPQLPIEIDYELPSYQRMRAMVSGHGPMRAEDFIAAQALKDATMAWRILGGLPAGGLLLHLNGSFHSDFHEGTVWYLKQSKPLLKVLVISTIEQESIEKPAAEALRAGDVLLLVPASMTKTYE